MYSTLLFRIISLPLFAALSLPTLGLFAQSPREASVAAPPQTQVHAVVDDYFGHKVTDNYRWLEDQNSPETRAWIDAQNAYTDSLLSKIPGREALKQQLAGLLKVDAMSSPRVRNGRYFFSKRRAGEDQSALYMRNGISGQDELLVDPLPMSPAHTTSARLANITLDGKVITYFIQQGGEDEVTPHILDVETKEKFPDEFPRARYFGFSVLPDKSGAWITRVTAEGPRVFFHKMGTGTASDTEIFGKGYGPDKLIFSSISEDGRYLLIEVAYGSAATKTELYIKDLKKDGPIVTIVNDIEATFSGDIAGGKLYIKTNWKAPRYRLLEVDLENPAREKWRELMPQSDSVLEDASFVGGRMALLTTKNVISHLKIYDLEGKFLSEISPPTIGSLSGLNGWWDSKEAFFSFDSLHVPRAIYRYDIATGKKTIWFQTKTPIQTDQYEVKQVWYPSKDGTKIPMFLAYAKGLKLDGTNPTLLTGYGGFNSASTPDFSARAASWMAHGGIYALANLRGGGEFGEDWHHAGMLEKKQNVFDDFIAAAEWLIQNKYTRPERLAISGSSNGGLLVGAAATQRPELFGAVECGFPLLDMLRYQNFLVARYWVPEYGSAEDAKQFDYIYAYSPYHHVKPGEKYPAVLFVTGDADTRVAPLHARKMAALMQASTGSDKPVLLHYDTKAGHAGGTPVSKMIDDLTNELSFLMWQLKMTPTPVQTAAR
ncbi:MAG TPA: prolyl oligopeptidase family serine peptidase [Candidatus Angelobacter sp.]|nr:prolyl oligopeptidase family serine peptidase [Candidatus Angelobacter sp.]